ncbi:TPA: hypothetical protein NBK42_004213 [Klebsiella pneumoniae]|nr:hypothetical protein [Klebsiella pneumoniae]HCD3712163.1 hypothetical protein [Klebsiella pneumoniae]HCD4732118.1 hypothetical protein [Klebsiella pneumoniae]HCD6823620.1 hypothetical protein [Klebsiella pneumoniae]HCH6762186.1 hypothetical protein [Klebsiella pneumoniae]
MTTDITELAQSLKAAAEKAIAEEGSTWWNEEQLASDYGLALHRTDAKFIALASHENILALVEALEKAQQRNSELEAYSKTALEFREAARDENRHLKLSLEAVEGRVIELDSRTVTAENLQESAYRAGLTAGWNLGLTNNNDGFNKCLAAHAAGIKVEGE